jgi:hypothetical protein
MKIEHAIEINWALSSNLDGIASAGWNFKLQQALGHWPDHAAIDGTRRTKYKLNI